MCKQPATSQLQEYANELLRRSVGDRTRAIYTRQIHKYLQFDESLPQCQSFKLDSLQYFIAQLHKDGKKHTSILGYVAALRYHCKIHRIANDLDSPILQMTLKGVRNMDTKSSHSRQVITTRILRKLCKAASSCFPPYEARLVQAVLAIAFYGFLRVSEYSKTKAGHVLLLTGCKVSATRVVITVPSSKFGKT